MHFIRPFSVIVFGSVLTAAAVASAQRSSVAVPIVGSPAAQQPSAPPAPPPMPPQPVASPQPSAADLLSTAPNRAQRKLELTLTDGTVALDAQNVTLRDILAEWQRRSGCQFVNADKLPAALVTLQFPAGTPELVAIDSLFRGLGTTTTGYGYIVGPPSGQGSNDPACGAVYILPTSRPTASASYMPTVSAPGAAPFVTPGMPDDEIPPVVPFPPGGPPPMQIRPGPTPTMPTVPGQYPNPNPQGQAPYMPTNQNPVANPGAQTPSFGPIAPSAPGAGRIGAPPATTPSSGPGRGGQ